MVRCSLIVQRENGKIKLVNLTSRITDLLTITRLVTVFDTYDTEASALASLS
jgi:anti-sigma B factor antagonist